MMLTTDMSDAAWVLGCVAVSSALVRLILAVLAGYAARKALRPSAHLKAADRAHHLAVLRALLDGLKPPRR
jgi:hypothetical protein